MKKLRIFVLMHEGLIPPENVESVPEEASVEWKTEFDVIKGLTELGHDVRPLGVSSDLGVIRDAIVEWKPHIAFNLLEEFHGVAVYDQHVTSYLELMRQAYTGCNPRGLMLSHDKVLSKKILSYHRVAVPDFVVIPKRKRVPRPKRLRFPLVVKSATEDASLGISQASIVTNDERLNERVDYIHEKLGTDALAEEYIEGRELYMGVMGNRRLHTFPTWEMLFTKMPEGVAKMATARVKWSRKYQKKHGIMTRAARDLPEGAEAYITKLCKRIYRILGISGYARMDLRLTPEGKLYVLEANPNPNLEHDEDFAESAAQAGTPYGELLGKILTLGLRYQAEWKLV